MFLKFVVCWSTPKLSTSAQYSYYYFGTAQLDTQMLTHADNCTSNTHTLQSRTSASRALFDKSGPEFETSNYMVDLTEKLGGARLSQSQRNATASMLGQGQCPHTHKEGLCYPWGTDINSQLAEAILTVMKVQKWIMMFLVMTGGFCCTESISWANRDHKFKHLNDLIAGSVAQMLLKCIIYPWPIDPDWNFGKINKYIF